MASLTFNTGHVKKTVMASLTFNTGRLHVTQALLLHFLQGAHSNATLGLAEGQHTANAIAGLQGSERTLVTQNCAAIDKRLLIIES